MNTRRLERHRTRSTGPFSQQRVMITTLVLALLWLLLTQGDMSSWVIGSLTVLLATACSFALFKPASPAEPQELSAHPPLHLGRLLRFVPFFLWQSLRGGWDNALYAILPRKRTHPGFFLYKTTLAEGLPRLCLLHLISLLPGTLSATVKDDVFVIHALSLSADNVAGIRASEAQLAALFGLNTSTPGSDTP